MGMVDIGFNGNSFTWCNKRSGEANIREILDRMVTSMDWKIQFDRAGVIHLNSSTPNHSLILLCSVIDHASKPKPFRFLEAWARDPSSERVVHEAWNKRSVHGNRMMTITQIRNTTRAFQSWKKNSFGIC